MGDTSTLNFGQGIHEQAVVQVTPTCQITQHVPSYAKGGESLSKTGHFKGSGSPGTLPRVYYPTTQFHMGCWRLCNATASSGYKEAVSQRQGVGGGDLHAAAPALSGSPPLTLETRLYGATPGARINE